MLQTNRTPFTDICCLIAETKHYDVSRHYTTEPAKTEIFCSFQKGVARAEFYTGLKAGVQLSATVEIWEAEYEDQRLLEHEDKLYRIVRTYPSGAGTLLLSCEEVER